jgi:hypothetical protein
LVEFSVVAESNDAGRDEQENGADPETDSALAFFGNLLGSFLRSGVFSLTSLLGSPVAASARSA